MYRARLLAISITTIRAPTLEQNEKKNFVLHKLNMN